MKIVILNYLWILESWINELIFILNVIKSKIINNKNENWRLTGLEPPIGLLYKTDINYILEHLQPLAPLTFSNKEEFLNAIEQQIGKGLTEKYQERILKHTERFISAYQREVTHLWAELPKQLSYKKACNRDNDYTQYVLDHKTLCHSPKFECEYRPYFTLNIAESQRRIGITLAFWIQEVKETSLEKIQPIANALLQQLRELEQREPSGFSEEDKEKIERLITGKIQPLVEKPSLEDSYCRLDLLFEAERLIDHFLSAAAKLYYSCYASLPHFAPAYMKFVELTCHKDYRATLEAISQEKTIPLETVDPAISFTIEEDTEQAEQITPHSIQVEQNERIVAYAGNGNILAVLKFDYADQTTIEHICQSVHAPEFLTNLQYVPGSSCARRILKTAIPLPMKTKLLLEILHDLLEPFTFLLAYYSPRMSPPSDDLVLDEETSSELSHIFPDEAIHTKEQQREAQACLDKMDNQQPIVDIQMNEEAIFRNISQKKGYACLRSSLAK